MLTNDKILAHKTQGKNLILLTQVESSYFLVVAQIVHPKRGERGALKAIFQKKVSEAEASAIYNELTGTHHPSTTQGILLLSSTTHTSSTSTREITLLLEGTVQATRATAEEKIPQPIVSPYFPTKDIFLSVQKTRAPASI